MHIPVLVNEVVDFLKMSKRNVFVDATLGCGGYTKKILDEIPNCKVVALDWDRNAVEYSKKYLSSYLEDGRLEILRRSYIEIKEIVSELKLDKVSGVVFDFGMSTLQLKTNRGFSFEDESFSMSMSGDNNFSAEYVINHYDEKKLSDIFYNYGEEVLSRKIARLICEYREKKYIKSAKELAQIIKLNFQKYYRKSRIHPATRIFQALRIFVNNELNNVEVGLRNALEVLESSGICVAVSYHSLEDRIVKNIFKEHGEYEIITKKPVVATKEEIKNNPSSRSAKLRVVRKL